MDDVNANADNAHVYSLSIFTPEKIAFEDQIYSVIVPGADGYFEVLAYHASLMALVQPGKLVIIDKNQQRLLYAVSSGIFEVSHNKATLLIDSIESVSEIDIERAKLAYERAHARIISHTREEKLDIDLERAKKARQRAEARIRVHRESQKH
jgi:F-type H+-transporting ATPase subunit epsilon